MVVFEALTWEARDEEGEHLISIFGRTEDGKSVCVTTAFNPYFFIKLPKNSTPDSLQLIFNKIKKECSSIIDYSIIQKKDLWGFQNNETFPFMKLNFKTQQSMKQCAYKLKRPLKDDAYPQKVFESNIEPMLRLMHRTEIQSTGWLDAKNCIASNISRVDIDLFCNSWNNLKPVNRDDIAPFIIASFDIETNSSTGKFPSADIPEDACFQIAITLKRHGQSELFDKTCLCYKNTDANLDGCNIVTYNTERELLLGFRDYIIEKDVDVMTGWNIFGFDLEYMYKRARMTGCEYEFSQISKFKNHSCEMSYKKLSSSALGDNELKLFPMPGRFIFDLFQEVKREKKLDSYSLNFVSTTYLGDQKIDMSPKEMFRRFKEEDPVKLREVAEYCIKDTVLPHQLMAKLYTFVNLIEMAKATWVPMCYLAERGQQIKVFSQLTRTARKLGFMVPTIAYGQIQSDPYQGATVLEPQSGAYYKPITALDFASLYPSIMRAHNLCYSTLVLDPKYDNLPGVTYESFTVGEFENKRTYKFAQNVPSLLPTILNDLADFRKQAKKDMAVAVGDMKKVYDGKQLAYKVSMNSVYGFTGASKGMLPCVAIASTVTCKGRSMIEETKNYVEANFPGAHVRYGDSVVEDTALLLRVNGTVTVMRIDELKGSKWISDGRGKEFSRLTGVQTWTENGWTNVLNVIRHETEKKILRVSTGSGCVTVTEDHSLLDEYAEMVKPNKVKVGDRLLHAFPCTFLEGPHKHIELLDSTIHETKEVKEQIIKELAGTTNYIYQETQVASLQVYTILHSLGYNIIVEQVNNKYKLTFSKDGVQRFKNKIKKIEEVRYFGKVYDLTTENHHFHAGVGSMIVHNTDSVMVEFDVGNRTGVEAIEFSWQQGEIASEGASKLFKHPNDLELEKVYYPYVLYKKKKYAAKLWTKGKDGNMHMNYIDVKGLTTVRRDGTAFVRDTCSKILDIILESNNPNDAVELARKKAVELLDGRVTNEELILSQKLADSYKSDNLPHVKVVQKMREREPGSEPQSGDRVQFILVESDSDKQFDMAEDPKWVKEHNIKLNYRYYFTNKFMNPVCDLLEPLIAKDKIFEGILTKKPPKIDKNQRTIDSIFARKKV